MLHPLFDRFTTVTVVHPKHDPEAEDIVFRLLGFYPIASLCVADPDSLKAPALKPEKRPCWRRGWLKKAVDDAPIAELQRVAAMLRRKRNKSQIETSVLTRLEAIIEAAQTRASHPDTATTSTTVQ